MTNETQSNEFDSVQVKSRFRKLAPLFFALIPILIVAYIAGRTPSGVRLFDLVGRNAPAITALTLESKPYTFRSSGWRVVHFWTTTCSECRAEIPEIKRFVEKTQSEPDAVELVNVNIQDTPKAAAEYVSRYGVVPVVLADTDGRMARSYGVTGVPETFFVDAKGIVRHHIVGAASTDEFERVLEVLKNASIVPSPQK